MQGEQQIQPAVIPETAPEMQSIESTPKHGHGGKRPGAGRKPNLAKRLLKGFSREAIAEAMATVDVGEVVISLLKSKRERTRIEMLLFVRDTLIGRPSQSVSLSGGVLHAHMGWRPLANLTDEEVRLLDGITKKLTQPDSTPLSDGPHNQIESRPAIEAEVMESDHISA